MVNTFDEQKLQNLRIHELRDLARKIGVRSPTSQKKEDVIEKILEIISGESSPYVSNTKQGRPAKAQDQINNIVDFFIPTNVKSDTEMLQTNYDVYPTEHKSYEFMANAPELEYDSDATDTTGLMEKTGLLEICENGHGVIHVNGLFNTDEDIFIHSYSVKLQNMKTGDIVKGYIKKLQPDKPYVMVQVSTINNMLVEELVDRKNFETIPYCPLSKQILFNENKSKLASLLAKQWQEGSRSLVLFENKVNPNLFKSFLESIDKTYFIYMVNLNSKPEDAEYERENIKYINVCFNKLETTQIEVVNMVLEISKRHLENGEHAIVVLNNLSAYYKALRGVFKNESIQAIEHKLKNALMFAKSTKEAGSLTLLVLDTLNEEPNLKNFVNYELYDLCNFLVLENTDKNCFEFK